MGSYLAILAAVPYFGNRPLVASSVAVLLVALGSFEAGAGGRGSAPYSTPLATAVIGTLFAVSLVQRFVWDHVEAVALCAFAPTVATLAVLPILGPETVSKDSKRGA